MKIINALLDHAKVSNGAGSDYRTAKLLAVKPTVVCDWRKCRSFPNESRILRLSEIAHVDAEYYLAMIHAERASDDKVAQAYRNLAERLSPKK